MADALLFAVVLVQPSTKIDVDFTHAVRVGEIGNDLRISGQPADLERLAAALMLAATNAREKHLVDALGTAGQPQTAGAA